MYGKTGNCLIKGSILEFKCRPTCDSKLICIPRSRLGDNNSDVGLWSEKPNPSEASSPLSV